MLRHGLFYAAVYVGVGMSTPYAAVWLHSVGLTAAQIGMVLAAPMLGRIAAGPLIGVWADSFGLRRTPMAGLALMAMFAFAALLVAQGFWAWLLLWFVATTALNGVSPLADVLTLIGAQRQGFSYAVARSCGSLAFVLANVAGGAMLAQTRPVSVILWSALAAGIAAIAALLLLPAEPVTAERHEAGHPRGPEPPTGPERQTGLAALKAVVADRRVMLAIAAVSLIQGSHALYYGFSAIAWTGSGLSEGSVGLLWGLSVAAEVGFFWLRDRLGTALPAQRLILLGAVGALVRWTVLAASPPLWGLVPLQALHALSFAATFVGGVEIVEQLCSRRTASTAQSLSASASFGLATGLATLGSGWLFERFHGAGYLAMSAMAAAGLVCAVVLSSAMPVLQAPNGKG